MDGPSSLLLRDPYPEHASNCFSRAGHSILHLLEAQTLTFQSATAMAASITRGLECITQVSYTASESLTTLTTLFQNRGIVVNCSESKYSLNNVRSTSVSEPAVTPGMLETETLKELGHQASADPALVTKTIERHEPMEQNVDFGLDYLQWIDFSAVAAPWEFQDCFSGL